MNKAALIDEVQLRDCAPRLYEYLCEYKDALTSRKTVQTHSRSWYELAWHRDHVLMEAKKLVIRDMATEPAFASDRTGGIHLVGGTGIVPASEEYLESLWAYLNSSYVEWLLNFTSPGFKAGFKKFEPGAISRLPVPMAVVEPGDVRDRLRQLADGVAGLIDNQNEELSRTYEAEIDDVLSNVLGVALRDVQ